jgi:hypothetical protein
MMMHTMILPAILVGSLALSGCAVSGPEDAPLPLTEKQAELLDRQLTGKVAGEATSCISHSPQANVIRVSDELLLYRVSGRLVYQNRLRSPCPGLARDDDVMVSRQWGSQQCRGDTFQLVDRVGGIPGPTCVLGDFVPYRTPPAS